VRAAADERANTREQFGQIKGFDEIVIRDRGRARGRYARRGR
jgi:hypothetical protein